MRRHHSGTQATVQRYQRPSRHIVGKLPKRSKKIPYTIAAALVIVGAVYGLFYSSLFQIHHIEASGNETISTEAIQTAVRQRLAERRWFVVPSATLLTVPDTVIAKDLRTPRVAGVTIERDFPNTLKVHVVEKKVAMIWLNNGVRYGLDSQGLVITETLDDTAADSLVITNSNRITGSTVGEQAVEPQILHLIRDIHAALQSQKLGVQVYDTAHLHEYRVDAVLHGGAVIRFHTRRPISEQATALHQFLLSLQKEHPRWPELLSYIDLRFGATRIYYRMK